MITLGEILDKVTGWYKREEKAHVKGTPRGMGLVDGGLHIHFHISLNIVQKEKGL